MADILIPAFPSESYDGWVGFEMILPNGYRHVASVERPGPDGTCCGHGEMYDLGQNAEGLFRLFRRGTGVLENSHVGNGEALSDQDLVGFGLTRADSPLDPEEGDYSSLCKSNLIGA